MKLRSQARMLVKAGLIVALLASVLGVSLPDAAAGDEVREFTFVFVNGVTLTGSGTDNTHFLADAGGSDVDNPTGMEVHLSCSDDFPDGWGEKDGPVQGVDTAWQLASYSIRKVKDGEVKKECSGQFTPDVPPTPPSIDIEKYVNDQDADNPSGPELATGSDATFTYVVTNTGESTLTDVAVVDDVAGDIFCPFSTLNAGEVMECDSTTMEVEEGQQTMKATVTALGEGIPVNAPIGNDKGYGYAFEFQNGTVISGTSTDKVAFIAGAGGTTVDNPTGIEVHLSCSDDFAGGWGEKDGPVQGVDTAWQLASFSIVKFKDGEVDKECGDRFAPPAPIEVMDMDPVYYVGLPNTPEVDIEKTVNGLDADDAPGPELSVNDPIVIEYVVTNTGDVPLTNVNVVDSTTGAVACPKSELDAGETMSCDTLTIPAGQADLGAHFMEATVIGIGNGTIVADVDPVNFVVVAPPHPSIDIEKNANGLDLDDPPGTIFNFGEEVVFTYIVTNNGNVSVEDIMVLDLDLGFRPCPSTTLAPGESMECESASIDGTETGTFVMHSVVMGIGGGEKVWDTDPVNFRIFYS